MLVGVLLAVTACAPAAAPRAAPDAAPTVDAQLQGLQQDLERAAEAGLSARTCPDPPEGPALAGLPDGRLACLGTGPAAAATDGDGRPTVVNLWASWCAPCVREMPLLQQTAQRAGDAARFVGIDTLDNRASGAGLLDATGVTYTQYDDPDGTVKSAVRAFGLPVTLVFDASGREVARRFGEVKGTWLDDALAEAGVDLPAPGPGAG